MTTDEPTLNDKWNKLLADADAGTIDARTAVIGTKEHYDAVYRSNFAAVIKMMEDMDRTIQAIKEHQEGVRGQLAQVLLNQPMITQHLERQDTKLDLMTAKVEKVSTDLNDLTFEFHSTDESLNQWRSEVDAEIADLRMSDQRATAERAALRAEIEEGRRDRIAIRKEQQALARAATEQAREMVASLEQLRRQHDTLAHGINGRLTELLKARQAEGREEGRDEERAHPGQQ